MCVVYVLVRRQETKKEGKKGKSKKVEGLIKMKELKIRETEMLQLLHKHREHIKACMGSTGEEDLDEIEYVAAAVAGV